MKTKRSSRYLGQKPIWNWLTSNTALANTTGLRQPVHKDTNFTHPKYPYHFIANIPLCNFGAHNGATEFWPGSHVATDVFDQAIATGDSPVYKAGDVTCFIADELREARRAVQPPIQLEVERGDIMIRDIRLWHAGMPNESNEHRIMLGLGYQASLLTGFNANACLLMCVCRAQHTQTILCGATCRCRSRHSS